MREYLMKHIPSKCNMLMSYELWPCHFIRQHATHWVKSRNKAWCKWAWTKCFNESMVIWEVILWQCVIVRKLKTLICDGIRQNMWPYKVKHVMNTSNYLKISYTLASKELLNAYFPLITRKLKYNQGRGEGGWLAPWLFKILPPSLLYFWKKYNFNFSLDFY